MFDHNRSDVIPRSAVALTITVVRIARVLPHWHHLVNVGVHDFKHGLAVMSFADTTVPLLVIVQTSSLDCGLVRQLM